MFEQSVRFSVKKHLSTIMRMCYIHLLIGCMVIGICQFMPFDENFVSLEEQTLPHSVWSIFMNNAKFSFIYAIPYIGALYYAIGFIFIYAIIGVYIYAYGYVAALGNLLHLPLEVLALTIPIFISVKYKKMTWKEVVCLIGISIVLLLFSAFIEFFMSRGV